MPRWIGLISPTPRPPRSGLTYVAVRLVIYVVALLFIVLVYGTRERGLLIAPPIGLLAGAGTWYLLGDTLVQPRRRLLLAACVGLVLAELTWGLGYWSVAPIVGGAGLWLGFYVLSGVVEQGASETLDRRIAVEYAIVAAVGVLVVAVITRPWAA